MAKRNIDSEIIKSVETFVAEASKHYKIDGAYLFGSFAEGTQHKDSDIDVAIISNDIKNTFLELPKMMAFRRKIDLRIEPHPIRLDEYQKVATPFIYNIIKTGIPIKL